MHQKTARQSARWRWALNAGIVVLCGSVTAQAGQITSDHLATFVAFDEGSGTVSYDRSGNSHDAKLVGPATWGNGNAKLGPTDAMVRIASAPEFRKQKFTIDIWFEARGSSLMDRFLIHADRIGAQGLDIYEWYGKDVAIRINRGADAVFNTPTVGSLTTSQPPNHAGLCANSFHTKDGPEHLVIINDGDARRVKVFIGLEGKPLKLCFDATYSGKYSASSNPLTFGNVPQGHKPHPIDLHQFAYYDKKLSYTVDSNNVVNGGELNANHVAGSNATTGSTPVPDAGPPEDASVVPDASTSAAECTKLLSAEYQQSLKLLDVQASSSKRLSFHVDGVPAPAGVIRAVIEMRLDDADHANEEGTVYVNNNPALQLPAKSAWNDQQADATLEIDPSHLVAGLNVIEFGAGPRDRTVYSVGRVALRLWGPACGPPPPPPSDDATVPSDKDASTPPIVAPRKEDIVNPGADNSSAPETHRSIGGSCQINGEAAPAIWTLLLLLVRRRA